jgi:hypothetical protein
VTSSTVGAGAAPVIPDRAISAWSSSRWITALMRLLVKHKYPPDKQPEAIKLVIEQMEALAPRYTK